MYDDTELGTPKVQIEPLIENARVCAALDGKRGCIWTGQEEDILNGGFVTYREISVWQ